MPLTQQILDAAQKFARTEAAKLGLSRQREARVRDAIAAGLVSGCSLAAHYLVANDGNAAVTPQILERAAEEVGKSLGLIKGKL